MFTTSSTCRMLLLSGLLGLAPFVPADAQGNSQRIPQSGRAPLPPASELPSVVLDADGASNDLTDIGTAGATGVGDSEESPPGEDEPLSRWRR